MRTTEEKKALEDMVETLTKTRSKILSGDEENTCEPETFIKNEEKSSPDKNDIEIDMQKATHEQKPLSAGC